MKYFVTGASGFIGRHLVWYLAEKKEQIIILLRKREDSILFQSYPNIQIIYGDLSDNLEKYLSDIDVVFHLAAMRGGVGVTLENFMLTNVTYTENLLNISSKKNVKKFVYCSSVSVLGHITNKPADENYLYNPATKYGISKMVAEKKVLEYGNEKGLNTTIIRPVITYGPYDDWGMVTKLIGLIHQHKYATVGNGNNTVHLCYIDDMIQGLIKASNDMTSNNVYIIAGENSISINELVMLIKKYLRNNDFIFHIPLRIARFIAQIVKILMNLNIIKFNSKAPVITDESIDIMVLDRSYCIKKAEENLKYEPKIDYEHGIKQTVNWYLKKLSERDKNGKH